MHHLSLVFTPLREHRVPRRWRITGPIGSSVAPAPRAPVTRTEAPGHGRRSAGRTLSGLVQTVLG